MTLRQRPTQGRGYTTNVLTYWRDIAFSEASPMGPKESKQGPPKNTIWRSKRMYID